MPLRKPATIAVAGLILGIAFDRLFQHGALGVNVPVFAVLIVAALTVSLASERMLPLGANVWLFAPLLFFAAMVAVRANSFLTFLNVVAVLLLLTLIAVYLLREPVSRAGVLGYAVAPFLAPFMAVVRGSQLTRHVALAVGTSARTPSRRDWGPALRGLLLAVPVVLVFAMLLTSADSIFSELISRLVPDNLMDVLRRLLGHGFLALAVGFVLAGGIAYALWRDGQNGLTGAPRIDLNLRRFLGFTEANIVVTAVNLLFLAFVVVQIPYLFGGQLNIHVDGFTYAEYARRGFGELVAVSVLVLGLLLFLGEFAHRTAGRQTKIFNAGSTLMVALTAVMLVSAFKRLALYEYAYGFTEMRLYPHVFMVWLAALLGWFLVTLWLRPGRFAVGLMLACVGFVATLDLINPDDFIVRKNVAREAALGTVTIAPKGSADTGTDMIDVDYLTRNLSDDAVPALIAARSVLAGGMGDLIARDLESRRERLEADRAGRTWPGYHLSRAKAYELLALRPDAQP